MIFWNLFIMLICLFVIVTNSVLVYENTSPLKTGFGIVSVCVATNCFIMNLAEVLDCLL